MTVMLKMKGEVMGSRIPVESVVSRNLVLVTTMEILMDQRLAGHSAALKEHQMEQNWVTWTASLMEHKMVLQTADS